MHHDKVWRLQYGQLFHAQCWDRVARAHVDRQLGGTMKRGVGLIAAEFHYALAGDQDAASRHGETLRGANEFRDLREELNRVTVMMMNDAAVLATTPAGQPASSANAVQATEATAPALDAPMPLIAETAN
eukprot:2216774-Pyramimonas_sp.AAC.1